MRVGYKKNRTLILPLDIQVKDQYKQLAKVADLTEKNKKVEILITTNKSERIFGQITFFLSDQVQWRIWKLLDNTQVFFLHGHILIVWDKPIYLNHAIGLESSGLKSYCSRNIERIVQYYSQTQNIQPSSTVKLSTFNQDILFFDKNWRSKKIETKQAEQTRLDMTTRPEQTSLENLNEKKQQQLHQSNQIQTVQEQKIVTQQGTVTPQAIDLKNSSNNRSQLPDLSVSNQVPDKKQKEIENKTISECLKLENQGQEAIQRQPQSPTIKDIGSVLGGPPTISSPIKDSPSKNAKRKMKKKEQAQNPGQTIDTKKNKKHREDENNFEDLIQAIIPDFEHEPPIPKYPRQERMRQYGLKSVHIDRMTDVAKMIAEDLQHIQTSRLFKDNMDTVIVIMQYSLLLEELQLKVPKIIVNQCIRIRSQFEKDHDLLHSYFESIEYLRDQFNSPNFDRYHAWVINYIRQTYR